MSAKASLLQECENLGLVLEETLRFKYGLDGSYHFYNECSYRLIYIKETIEQVAETDVDDLRMLASHLVELSGLVSRIERSSLGEYSWPFVEELKNITTAICTEKTVHGDNIPLKVYVLSDGGLDTYCIHTENRTAVTGKKRILTIVFPRTLKHFVLLHPILGHEVGHAIWRCSQHQRSLKEIIQDEFYAEKLESPDKTAEWLCDVAAPPKITNTISQYGLNRQDIFTQINWDSWVEELLCDLIGVLTFGPSFIAAECDLLLSLSPAGIDLGPNHPPTACRINMILKASEILKLDNSDALPEGVLKEATKKFWETLNANRRPESWFDILSEGQLQKTLDRITALLERYAPTLYPKIESKVFEGLFNQLTNEIPPVGYNIKTGERCSNVDFRHILFTGWVAKSYMKNTSFLTINRLCEHAIMQQRGINTFTEGQEQ